MQIRRIALGLALSTASIVAQSSAYAGEYRGTWEEDSDRNARHEALRLSRRALRPKPPELKDDISDQ